MLWTVFCAGEATVSVDAWQCSLRERCPFTMQSPIGSRWESVFTMSFASRVAVLSLAVLSLLSMTALGASPSDSTCAESGKELPLLVSTAGQSVAFSCGATLPTLKPSYPASTTDTPKVFSDTECKREASLQALVPDAKFEKSDAKTPAVAKYTLTVPTLPKSEQVFFFLCDKAVENGSSAGQANGLRREASPAGCRVKVTVQGSSGNSATTGIVARACLSAVLVAVSLVSYF